MERVDVIKDMCQQLGLTQIGNSWIKTLGQYLNVQQEPGPDDYEQRVFTAAVGNSEQWNYNISNSDLTIDDDIRTLTLHDDTTNDRLDIIDTNGNNVISFIGGGQVNIGNIGVSPTSKFEITNTTKRWGIEVAQNVADGSNATYGLNINNFGATGHTGEVYGIRARAYGNASKLYGATLLAQGGNGNTESYGLFASSNGGSTLNVGILSVASGTNPYLGRFVDGTQGTGKAMLCTQSDGRANWGKITSTYTSGATGTFTSQDGKTVTVTNGLITSIV